MKPVNRVLGRLGARALTIEEVELVAGSVQTRFCTGMRTTGIAFGDGDGCSGDGDLG